jgi:hypothetical protein
VQGSGVTDLFVLSHGWNNDMADARALYTKFFRQARAALDAGAFAVVVGGAVTRPQQIARRFARALAT